MMPPIGFGNIPQGFYGILGFVGILGFNGIYGILWFVCAYLARLKLPGKAGVRGLLGFGLMGSACVLEPILFFIAMQGVACDQSGFVPQLLLKLGPELLLLIARMPLVLTLVGWILVLTSLMALPRESQ